MAAEQKHDNYLSEAESRLRQLSSEQLQVVVAFLTYLQATEKYEVTEQLLSIPGFAVSLRATENSQDKIGDLALNAITTDDEVWQAYLVSKQKRQEVYRRLANS
jgi:hypothetical protein